MTTEMDLHRAPLEFTPEQRKIIIDSFLPSVDEKTCRALLEVAKIRRLNPLTRQIAFIERNEPDANGNWVKKWTYVVTIDGLRAKAEECPGYDGQSEPEFKYDEGGSLISCKVSVFRKDRSHPFTYVAFFEEFKQTKKDGSLTRQWTKKHMMLSKCTEAGALRKAFPDELGGLYTDDEMPSDGPAPTVASPSAAKAKPAGSGDVIDGDFVQEAPVDTIELMASIESAETIAALQSLVAALAKIPDGDTKKALRKAYSDKQEALKKS